jgi:hypothetical protein
MKPLSANSIKTRWDRTTDTLGTLFVGVLALAFFVGGILLSKIAFESTVVPATGAHRASIQSLASEN